MAEETAIPTTDNTVAEIKAYLDEQGIPYKSTATKSELLDLVNGDVAPDEPVDQPEPVETLTEPVQPPVDDTVVEPVPEPTPAPVEPYYTKAELVGLVGGRLRDYFNLALKNDRTYTYAEATQAVEEWKNSASMF